MEDTGCWSMGSERMEEHEALDREDQVSNDLFR